MSVAAVLVALFLAWFLQHEGLDRADKWSSVVFGSVSALVAMVGALAWLWRLGDADVDDRRERSLSRLADSQREQWTAEQAARRVRDPWALNVRWVSSTRAQAVMASWASVRRSPGAGPVDVDGDYEQIATVLDRDDMPRRLVILGEPGAGKSMLAIHLTLQLLAQRGIGDPVAVLLNVAGWNPSRPLDDWIAGQLIALDQRLATAVPGPESARRSLARDLIAAGSVLPVLDGLDELDEEVQRAALIGISAAAAAGREFVVTCRTEPYEAAVRVGEPIPAAVVVELQPVPAAEAAQHLADGARTGDRRWAPIVAHLNQESTTPLARALSTPLMIWLTRMVYQDPTKDPKELLDENWSTSRRGIEEHLLDYLIPAAYATTHSRHPARSPIAAERAHRLLSLIARHMRKQRSYDFAWWQLSEVYPAPAVQLISVVFAIIATLYVIVISFFGMATIFPDDGSDLPWFGSLLLGACLGIFVSFARLLFADPWLPRMLTLRGARTIFLTVGVPLFLVATMTGNPKFGIGLGLSAGLVTALASGATTAPSARSPSDLLHADRTAAFVSGATIGLTTSILFAVTYRSPYPLTLGAALATALAAILVSAWGQLHLAELMIAVFRRTPLRLTSTLQEACDRGILRRAGGVYQFRHGLLRNRISDPGKSA